MRRSDVSDNDGGGLLEEEGLFLPEEQHGELDLDQVEGSLATAGLGGGLLAACTAMALGDGGTWTWIGSGIAMALFIAFGATASRSIERQNRRVDELTDGAAREHALRSD